MKNNLQSYIGKYYPEYLQSSLVCSTFENYVYQSKYFQSQEDLSKDYSFLKNSKLLKIFDICIVGTHINLSIKYSEIEEICKLYLSKYTTDEKVILDFIGTNFGKKMHFGHLRSIILGTILRNILLYYGFCIETDSHFGDYGINLAIFIKYHRQNKDLDKLSLDQILEIYKKDMKNINNENEKEYTNELILFSKKEIIAKETHKILDNLNKEYVNKIIDIFGTHIDYWNGESDYLELIDSLIHEYLNNNKIFYNDKDNRIVTNNKLVLTRSDKTPIYSFTDLATMVDRVRKEYDTIIYLVDKRQSFHFKQIIEFLDKNIVHQTKIYHLGFGFIQGENNTILKSRGASYNCILSVISDKVKKYNTNIEHIKMAFFLYELRHDIKKDYILVDSILDDHIVKIIEFYNKLENIKNSRYCCNDPKKCVCLSDEEKAIIKDICLLYENTINAVNKLNIHLIYKPLYKIVLSINKYKKDETSIILVITINQLLKNLFKQFFDYNIFE